jgi:hypothetical protein
VRWSFCARKAKPKRWLQSSTQHSAISYAGRREPALFFATQKKPFTTEAPRSTPSHCSVAQGTGARRDFRGALFGDGFFLFLNYGWKLCLDLGSVHLYHDSGTLLG